MARINDVMTNFKIKWQKISRPGKVGIVSGILSVIVIGFVAYFLLTKVQYGVLFTNVNQGDAGNITETLKSQNIPYKLVDGGNTILIPKDKVDQTRIDLATANKLPNSTQGFELFDKTNMMTTDQDRKIIYQRALTGELERSINTLNTVQSSRVILVTPSQSVFDDTNNGKASASITLTLKGNTIPDSAVQGIVALTSAAVENLNPDNIKVVDSNGRVLADGSKNGGQDQLTGANGKFLTVKEQYETTLTDKLTQLLNPIYGPGKFQVAINVDLDLDSVQKNTVKYTNPKIRSENLQVSGNAAQKQQQSGQPNNAANVTGDKDNDNSSYNRTINNELDTDTTKIVNAPGSIKRLTASVVLNSNATNSASNEQVQAMVSNAIGFNQQRGDIVNIQDVDFAKTKTVKEPTEKKNNTALIIGLIIGGLVFVIALIVLFLVLRKRKQNKEEYEEYEEEEEEIAESIPVKQIDEEIVSPIETKTDQAKEYAAKSPEVVADLVKTWVRENK